MTDKVLTENSQHNALAICHTITVYSENETYRISLGATILYECPCMKNPQGLVYASLGHLEVTKPELKAYLLTLQDDVKTRGFVLLRVNFKQVSVTFSDAQLWVSRVEGELVKILRDCR